MGCWWAIYLEGFERRFHDFDSKSLSLVKFLHFSLILWDFLFIKIVKLQNSSNETFGLFKIFKIYCTQLKCFKKKIKNLKFLKIFLLSKNLIWIFTTKIQKFIDKQFVIFLTLSFYFMLIFVRIAENYRDSNFQNLEENHCSIFISDRLAYFIGIVIFKSDTD